MLLSHEAVQEVLNELWQGDIKKPMTFWGGVFQTLFIYIGAFTFFTIPTIVSLNNNRSKFCLYTNNQSEVLRDNHYHKCLAQTFVISSRKIFKKFFI